MIVLTVGKEPIARATSTIALQTLVNTEPVSMKHSATRAIVMSVTKESNAKSTSTIAQVRLVSMAQSVKMVSGATRVFAYQATRGRIVKISTTA